MAVEEVDGYQRRSNGRLIQVKAHDRQNQDATLAGLEFPGRPMMAGKPAKYANGRALPGVWLDLNRSKDAAAKIVDSAPVPKPKVEKPENDMAKATAKTKKAVEAMEKLVAKRDSGK